MGPWGPDMPVRPDEDRWTVPEPSEGHCELDCCRDWDTCRCACSFCDCRYANRQGS